MGIFGHGGLVRSRLIFSDGDPKITQTKSAEQSSPHNLRLPAFWAKHQHQPAEQTDELAFLRRVTLDLAGRVATLEELRDYTLDRRADKRLVLGPLEV